MLLAMPHHIGKGAAVPARAGEERAIVRVVPIKMLAIDELDT
jgi:hypothetical protein